MKKGFTLLELIVVIIILGVLATLAVTQYLRMIEKSRGAEARVVIGEIRTSQAAYRLQNGVCTLTDANVGIGSEIPGPAAGDCASTHWFWYDVTVAGANGFTVVATRCTTGGKVPTGTGTAGTVKLVADFSTGADTWTTTEQY